jgi:hypothetical protein
MTTKHTTSEAPEVDPRFAPVVSAFTGDKLVTGGKMMSSYCLKIQGKIFVMFGKNRFVAKLPQKRVDELVSERRGERFDPGHGRIMKEWVTVGPGKADLVELAREAYQFVKRG